ncbi:MAG: hypothetical protein RL090_1136, partial [Bacteroidota bacterium]
MGRKKIGAFNEDFDFRLFSVIARKNAIWLALFILVSVSLGYLYVRYTPPLFEAYTVLKISDENQAVDVLGQRSIGQLDNINKLAGDIELIRSQVLARRVVDAMNIGISYYSKGTVLDFELYTGSPFNVDLDLKDSTFMNQPVFVEFTASNKYNISFSYNGSKISKTGLSLGSPVQLPFGNIVISANKSIRIKPQDENSDNKGFYFTINSPDLTAVEIIKSLNVIPLNVDANTILLKVTGKNAVKATDIANKLADEFNKYDVEKSSEAANSVLGFLDNTLTSVDQE